MRRLLLLLVLVLTGCAPSAPSPAAPVSAAETDAVVGQVLEVAARRTAAAMRELCAPDRCTGLSSSIGAEPERAPGADRPPRLVCSLALPPTSDQAGPRLVVLAGTAGDGRPYVTQVLLERGPDGVVVHEPGFWLGIRYTSLQRGRAWSGSSDEPATAARDRAAALRPCDDRTSWLDEVTGA